MILSPFPISLGKEYNLSLGWARIGRVSRDEPKDVINGHTDLTSKGPGLYRCTTDLGPNRKQNYKLESVLMMTGKFTVRKQPKDGFTSWVCSAAQRGGEIDLLWRD